jgi:hypothetical protein
MQDPKTMELHDALKRAASAATVAVLLGSMPAARAATVLDLYSVTVVPDATAADRRTAALQAAMTRLLIRVTGSRNVPLDPAAQTLIAAPDAYLTSYGVDRQGRAVTEFSRSQVERALAMLGVPVWGPERPLTLLWVAVDDGMGGHALLGANEATEPGATLTPTVSAMLAEMRTEIAAVADERGLPIALPFLDPQDTSAVTFTDVWLGFEQPLLAASMRYRADAVLIGRVRPGVLGNDVDWLFVSGAERQALPLGVARDGLDAAADRYAAELSTIGGASLTAMTVRNVRTSADYARVMSYLERQSILERVDVESFAGGTLDLRVAARGDARVLGRVLALGGVLRPADSGLAGPLTFEVVANGSVP